MCAGIVLNISDVSRILAKRPQGTKMDGGTPASVLVAICGPDMRVLLTKKSANLRIHAGQISFPGGKPEKDDTDLIHTAIRETREESGLNVKREQVLANLDDVRTLGTGYVITPYVCVLEKPFGELIGNVEVERIYNPKLYDLFQTRTTNTVHDISDAVEFSIKDEVVWGASARILEQIRLLIESSSK